MKRCSWCKRLKALGVLCPRCRAEVEKRGVGAEAHAALDRHVDTCLTCRMMGALCYAGSTLRAKAMAVDGRIDKEYALVFGSVDPQGWFENQGGQLK